MFGKAHSVAAPVDVYTAPQEECLSEKSTSLRQSYHSEIKDTAIVGCLWRHFGTPPKELSCKGKLMD